MDGKFEQTVPIEYTGDKCGLLDDCEVGDEVTCTFNISGRAWNDRYFVSLRGWKLAINKESGGGMPDEQDPRPAIPPCVKDAIAGAGLEVDDTDSEIPF